jgi:hypothetical protein
MRKRVKIALGATVVVIVIAFFFAPVLYWENISPTAVGNWPIYRSLGCATLGIGALYGPNHGGAIIGYHFGCKNPPQWERYV